MKHARVLATNAAALALAAAGLAGAGPAAAASSAGPAATPTLDVTVTARHVTLSGRWDSRPGLLTVRLHAVGDEQDVALVRLRPGYSLQQYEADEKRAEGEGDQDALARVRAHRELLGDVDTQPGRPESFTVGLGPGTYYLYSASYGVVDPHRLVVSGPVRPSRAPRPTAVIEERDNAVTAPPVLPRSGRIVLVDRGHQEHLLCLNGVRRGTTAAEVRDYLQNPGDAAPAFATGLTGCAGALSPGRAQLWSYTRPPGEYVLFDPTPDPRADGAPFAVAGVLRIVCVR